MPSIFAEQIKQILDAICENMNFKWNQVAIAFGVSENELYDWVNDRNFPKPETLRSIHYSVHYYSGMEKAAALMETILNQEMRLITPLAEKLAGFRKLGDCRTLNDYIVLPIVDAFVRTLQTVDREIMEVILLEASARTRELRDNSHTV